MAEPFDCQLDHIHFSTGANVVLTIAFVCLFVCQFFNSHVNFSKTSVILFYALTYLVSPIFFGMILVVYYKNVFHFLKSQFKKPEAQDYFNIILFALLYIILDSVLRYTEFYRSLHAQVDIKAINEYLMPEKHYSIEYTSGFLLKIYAAVSAGVVEEIYYKLILFNLLVKYIGSKKTIMISTLLFALAHLEQGLVFAVLEAGLLYGMPSAIYYNHSKNIVFLIVLHSLIDLFFS